MRVRPSHVAVLVRSVERAAELLARYDFKIGPAEIWEDEGTREIYVERGRSNSLLLMEPIKPGAYQRALKKRGPGLHHLAIDVLSLDAFLESIATSGWLLHPISIKTMKATRTAYLARPGFPALIEVQEREELKESTLFVNRISLPTSTESNRLISSIGLGATVIAEGATSGRSAKLRCGEHEILVEDLA